MLNGSCYRSSIHIGWGGTYLPPWLQSATGGQPTYLPHRLIRIVAYRAMKKNLTLLEGTCVLDPGTGYASERRLVQKHGGSRPSIIGSNTKAQRAAASQPYRRSRYTTPALSGEHDSNRQGENQGTKWLCPEIRIL